MKGKNIMSIKPKEKGFTIIEVVLVLAIAGLIFLMVFVALPGLQKSQRDTQRKSDLSRIITQITAYSSSNRGAIPTGVKGTGSTFVANYLGGTGSTAGSSYQDPKTGNGYEFVDSTVLTGNDIGTISYAYKATCGTDGTFTVSTNARQYAIEIELENQTAPYCLDNQ